MEREPTCVCPFCGFLYNHDELVEIYAEATEGTISRSKGLEKLNEFIERVRAAHGNA